MTCCSISLRSESFSSAAERWRGLVSSSTRATVFDLPTWQETWWQHFGESKQAKILTVNSDDGELDLLAPLMQEKDTVSFLGGTDLVDYHDFICHEQPPQTCIEAVIAELSADNSVQKLLFESVVESSFSLAGLPEALKSDGWGVVVEKEDVSPRLELADDWDEYLAGLRKKDRHELRRKLRRLDRAGEVTHLELTDPEEIETAMPDFFELHRMSTPDKQEFMTAEREAFFKDVAVRLAGEGVTRLSFLEVDGEKTATSLSFVVGTTRYLYNSGYNPEHYRLSVGLLNHAYTIQKSIEQGHTVFDFMRGNEPYKYHLGGIDREVFRIEASR